MNDRRFRREVTLAAFAIGVTLLILVVAIGLSALGVFESVDPSGPWYRER